jgi:hypothetical protein
LKNIAQKKLRQRSAYFDDYKTFFADFQQVREHNKALKKNNALCSGGSEGGIIVKF